MAADKNSDTVADPVIKVELVRAHWIGTDRIDPPAIIEVSLDDALRLIENGVAKRTDKLRAE